MKAKRGRLWKTISIIVLLICSIASYYLFFKNDEASVQTNTQQSQIPIKQEKEPYTGTIPFLYYHSINDKPIGIPELSVTVAEFEQQMEYLKQNGYTPVHFKDLANLKKGDKPVVITFDDGYKDNFTVAYPVLKKYNFKATIFIVTNSVGKDRYVSLQDINEMKDLVAFENHTSNHQELTKVDIKTAKSEIVQANEWILNNLGYKSTVFCYPVGKYNQEIKEFVKKNFDYAVSLESGKFMLGDNPYVIPRIYIKRGLDISQFDSKLKNATIPEYVVSKENIDLSNKTTDEAQTLYQQRDYKGAIQKAKIAVELNNTNYRAYNLLGISYAFTGNYETAYKNLEKSISQNPKESAGYYSMAICYKLQKKYDNTIYYFDKTLELNPKNAWCYYGKATIFAERKDVENCISNLKKAIEIDASIKDTAKAEKEFNPIRESIEFKNLIMR